MANITLFDPIQKEKPYILLDRDGVINDNSAFYIRSVKHWRPLERSLEAMAALSQAGYNLAIVTNQSGVGRGYLDLATLDAIHKELHQRIQILGGSLQAVAACLHTPQEYCECRKPKCGLLNALRAHGLDWSKQSITPFLGDSPSDWSCAQQAGCLPIAVGHLSLEDPVLRFIDLAHFTEHWLGRPIPKL